MSYQSRFEAKYIPEPNSGCWLWMARCDRHGYGAFQLATGRPQLAHRVAWTLYRSPIPPGMVIDHQCRNPTCVNPDHLRVVTPRINAIENSVSFAAVNSAKTRCPKCGGPYHLVPNGKGGFGRRCRDCLNKRLVKWAEQRRRNAGIVTRDEWRAGKRSQAWQEYSGTSNKDKE